MTSRTRTPIDMIAGESGESPVTAVFGVAIFLGFLLMATQVLLHLYASSTVSAAAFDAARLVAGAESVTCSEAKAHARGLLGEYGQEVTLTCGNDGEQVTFAISAPTPAPLLSAFGTVDLGTIERVARVRIERFQTAPAP